jgi:sulfide:quinone oxidoreductase
VFLRRYQPLWTLVGGGLKPLSESRKSLRKVVPEGASLVKGAFAEVDPVANLVTLADGKRLSYDFLVMAAGLGINWNSVPGLPEALAANNGVSSNYSPAYVENTWSNIRKLKSGKAIFTFPATAVKCVSVAASGVPSPLCEERATAGRSSPEDHVPRGRLLANPGGARRH